MASTDRHPLYDVSITDGTNTVYGNICDQRGKPDRRSFKSTQQPSASLRIYQGGTERADNVPPFRPMQQNDFSGGRGSPAFEKDATKFFDSYRCNTWMPEKVCPGPEEQYGTGLHSASIEYWWDQDATRNRTEIDLSGDAISKYISVKFTVGATAFTPKYVQFCVDIKEGSDATGGPAISTWGGMKYKFECSIYSDDTGKPDSELFYSNEYAPWELGTRIFTCTFSNPSELAIDTTYHLVIKCMSLRSAGTNYAYVLTNESAGYGYTSPDATTWTSSNERIYFRLYPADYDYDVFMFEHFGALYAIKSYHDSEALGYEPDVFINGDRGTCTGPTGATDNTTLQDTDKAWTVNEWAGAICRLVTGLGSEASLPWRVIASNTADTLTVSEAWEVKPSTDTKYAIVNTNKWTEKADHGLVGKVTDVLQSGNIVYVCLGDNNNLRHMYDDVWSEEVDNRGTYITEAVSTTTSKRTIYLAEAGWPPMVYSAAPVWCEDGLTVPDLDFATSLIERVKEPDFIDGNMEAGSEEWEAVGAAVIEHITHSPEGPDHDYVYQGNYSLKVTGDVNEGVMQTITLQSGAIYRFRARVHCWLANKVVNMYLDNTGTEHGNLLATNTGVTSYYEWYLLDAYFTATSASMDLQFLCGTNGCEFCLDNVLIDKIGDNLEYFGDERITNLLASPEDGSLNVMTTGGIYREMYGYYLKISPQEISSLKDDRNGFAAIQFGEYLFMSYLDGVARFYQNRFDQVGFNLDEGLPEDRRGNVTDFAVYPGMLIAAVDGMTDNYSSIMLYNGLGWHELYRSPRAGARIRNLHIQTIPGRYVDRLWFGEGSDIAWVGLDINPLTNDTYLYTCASSVSQATISGSMPDVDKHFHKIKLVWSGSSDGLFGNVGSIYSAYGDRTYTEHVHDKYVDVSNSYPTDTFAISYDGKLIYLKHVFLNAESTYAAILRNVVLEFVEHVPVTWIYSFLLYLGDDKTTLAGGPAHVRAETDVDKLQAMCDDATPITLTTPFSWAESTMKLASVVPQPLFADDGTQMEGAIVQVVCMTLT